MTRMPDARLDFYLVPYGYQADFFVNGRRIASLCRDYGGQAKSREVHITALVEEFKLALDRLRGRFENNDKVKHISIAEFRAFGFLQEVNRQFFHPLGLALEVVVDDDGDEVLGGIWDFRDDPEGVKYAEVDSDKMRRVEELQNEKAIARLKLLGYIIQRPISEE